MFPRRASRKTEHENVALPSGGAVFFRVFGRILWQFCDIRVSGEWWGVRPRTMNNKGVFDEYRRPKLCHATVRQLFAQDAAGKKSPPENALQTDKEQV